VDDGPSIFDVLNIFRHKWFLHRDHLIANVLSAQKDAGGHFTWVDFQALFHTHLVKCMLMLLPPLCPIAKGKQVLFVFLLEILDREGPQPFFNPLMAKKHQLCPKKHSPASPPPATPITTT